MEKLKRVVFYIRVSTEEQKLHGLSLDAQKMKLEEYAKEHNYIYIGSYVDDGVSGRKQIKKRPALQRMLKDAEKDIFDLIIFIKLDRYFRSVAEYHECQKILDNFGIKWTATEEKYDLTTANGRAFINMKLTIAELEADQTSERIKLVNEYKVKEGYALSGSVPFGFKLKHSNGHSKVVKDPETEHIVYDLINHYETYHNLAKAKAYLEDKYNIYHTYKLWRNVLTTPYLYGAYRNNSSFSENYIDKERYDKIQKIIKERNIPRVSKNRIYLFSRLVKCGACGSSMVGNYVMHGEKSYLTYRCNAYSRPNITCAKVYGKSETKIEAFLLKHLHEKLKAYIISATVQSQEKKLPKVNDVERLKKEIDKLNYMFQKSRIEIEQYDQEYSRLEKQLREAKTLNSKCDTNERDLSHIQKLLDTDIKTMYSSLDREHKQSFWQSIIKQITITDGVIDFEVKGEFTK